MHRCLDLARLGAGQVAPNPMAGAVLVNEGRIIGEGYHRQYGQAHAEVNCMRSVKKKDEPFVPRSILYVSLEPCVHYGKTPPCTDLIIEKRIPRVVIGCRDPFPQVNGKGIEKLMGAGVEVETGILESESMELNKRFFTFHTKHRPYIILKWTESADGKLANADYSREFISNEYSNRLIHKWRSQEASLLVGTNTAFYDDPSLNLRFWKGSDPLRLVLDRNLRLPPSLKLFDKSRRTIIFNFIKQEEQGYLIYKRIPDNGRLIYNILMSLYELKVQSVIVEGGTRLLQSFIDEGCWDEARVIVNREKSIVKGIPAPLLNLAQIAAREELASDNIGYYYNQGN